MRIIVAITILATFAVLESAEARGKGKGRYFDIYRPYNAKLYKPARTTRADRQAFCRALGLPVCHLAR